MFYQQVLRIHAHTQSLYITGLWELGSSFMPNREVLYLQHKNTISRLKQQIYQMSAAN